MFAVEFVKYKNDYIYNPYMKYLKICFVNMSMTKKIQG
jgi:hypothetical protein